LRDVTDEEKERAKAWATAKARAQHPGARITVVVSEMADPEGRVHVTTVTTATTDVLLEEILEPMTADSKSRKRPRDPNQPL
jgi:hypothetical protein